MNAKQRYIFLLIIDSIIVSFSVFVCYFLLSPFYLNYTYEKLLFSSVVLLISHHFFAYIFNLYHRAWEYASVRELVSIFKAVTCSILATYIINLIFLHTSFTRLMIITWMMHLILIGGSRLSWRIFRNKLTGDKGLYSQQRRTLIVGAGRGGSLLIKQLLDIPAMGMKPLVVVDDDPSKFKVELVGGVKVEGNRNDISKLVSKYDIEKIVIAIPSLSKKELNRIYEEANKCDAQIFIMPNIDDVLAGKLEVSPLKKVEVEDLLGREPVVLNSYEIIQQVRGKTVMVTGGGGSIGSEIIRQISNFEPSDIIILGHGENSVYAINEEMRLMDYKINYHTVIADIQDKKRMEEVFQKFQPNIVYHAAAHKHVPLMEANPIEAFKNNVIGTKNVAELSIEYGASKFVMISTDKAVNPPNVMGATKRLAEIIVQNLSEDSKQTTLVAVRFGNVLGSRGSVIPKFKKQIELGGPITITDERMTRYFMTIPEASRLVIQAGALAHGGEIFVLDMGEPVKIVDLAKNMIKLSGFSENDIAIEYTGIRPGEKLYEELLSSEEVVSNQVFEKIYVGKNTKIKIDIENTIEDILNSNNIKQTLLEKINVGSKL